MIKVLFLIPTLGHGGAERVLVNLVNHMDKSKFDITVQAMFDVGIYKDKLDKNVKYIGGFPWYFRGNTYFLKLFSPKLLFRYYIKEKYDVVISYLEGPCARVVSGISEKDTKIISWIHIQLDDEKYASHSFRSMEEARMCYGRFDRIICVSETVKDSFCSTFDSEKLSVQVIYNTIETDVIREKSLESVDDISFSKESINLISVAKLMKSKGYDRLIRVVKRLVDDGFPVHVYIVGKGEELVNLSKMVEENDLGHHWSFVGFRTNPYKYVRESDLYVCSSRIEGFSTAVTEALIVGTPVVSTDCSGAKELLGYHNEYGIVTVNNEEDLYRGIKTMIESSDTLMHYKKMAEIRGDRFNTAETVKEVENMLEEVVS